MRNSTLLAGVLALLIVACVAFGAGYYVAKQETEPETRPVVAADSKLDEEETVEKTDEEKQPPERPEPSENDQTPPPETDFTPAPASELPAADAAPDPDTSIKDKLKAVAKELDPDSVSPESFKDVFNGPKVDLSATLSGRVVDATNAPVFGASVYAEFRQNFTSEDGGRTINLVMGGDEPRGTPIATTDGGGYWTATVNRQVAEGASLRISLTARARGYADSRKATVTVKDGDTKEGIELALRGAGSVTGRVVDSMGRGVAGVNVSLRAGGAAVGDFVIFNRGGGKYSAVTDGMGEFMIEDAAEGRYQFSLSGVGYRQISGPTEIDIKSGQTQRAAADFQVAVTSSLKARFVDAQGAPVTGWVTFTVKDDDGKVVKRISGALDGEGVFDRNDPPAGNFEVEIRVHGFKPVVQRANFVDGRRYDFGTLTLEKDESTGGGTRSTVVPWGND